MVFYYGSPSQLAKHPSATHFFHSSPRDLLESYQFSAQHSRLLPISLRVRVSVLTRPGTSHSPSAFITSPGHRAAPLPRASCKSYSPPPHRAPAPLMAQKFLRHTTVLSWPLHILPSLPQTFSPYICVTLFLTLQVTSQTSLLKRTFLTILSN